MAFNRIPKRSIHGKDRDFKLAIGLWITVGVRTTGIEKAKENAVTQAKALADMILVKSGVELSVDDNRSHIKDMQIVTQPRY